MDILSPKGMVTAADEQRAARIFECNFPHLSYISTPKDRPAAIDAVIVQNNQIIYCVETKCRYDMTLKSFFTERNGEWLITYDKLLRGAQLAKGLQTKLLGFLYIVSDNVLLVQSITDEDGNFECEMRLEICETQRTVNGGKATRENAFLNMREARIFY